MHRLINLHSRCYKLPWARWQCILIWNKSGGTKHVVSKYKKRSQWSVKTLTSIHWLFSMASISSGIVWFITGISSGLGLISLSTCHCYVWATQSTVLYMIARKPQMRYQRLKQKGASVSSLTLTNLDPFRLSSMIFWPRKDKLMCWSTMQGLACRGYKVRALHNWLVLKQLNWLALRTQSCRWIRTSSVHSGSFNPSSLICASVDLEQ